MYGHVRVTIMRLGLKFKVVSYVQTLRTVNDARAVIRSKFGTYHVY